MKLSMSEQASLFTAPAQIFTDLGIDEAGRGCLAGPVVAAAVFLPSDHGIQGLDDSKKLSEKVRTHLAQEIFAKAHVGIGLVWQKKIDAINILQATFHAMAKAVNSLMRRREISGKVYLHIDGNKILPATVLAQYLQSISLKQKAIVGGDALIPSIAAASIVAKTHRDSLLTKLSARWPEYNFAKHKGYGTKEHLAAIAQYGACPLHRLSFAPLNITTQDEKHIKACQGRLIV